MLIGFIPHGPSSIIGLQFFMKLSKVSSVGLLRAQPHFMQLLPSKMGLEVHFVALVQNAQSPEDEMRLGRVEHI